MFQRFDSLYELKTTLPLENFCTLPVDTENKCIYCGLDLYEILYEDDFNIYARCRLCNSFWIISTNSMNYA